jgi:hypothetical protein
MVGGRFNVKAIYPVCLQMTLIFILALPQSATFAATGLPESAQFGYGARLDVWGGQINPSISAAAAMGLNWIAVDFNWGRYWPEANLLPDPTNLYQVMGAAQRGNLHVLVSITNAPSWATTPTGPDPHLTAGLVLSLYRLFPDTMLAAELFPGANILSGWGADPNPKAYADLLNTTYITLREAGADLLLVAGGFHPLGSSSSEADIEETAFLNSLYQSGVASYMPVVSMRLAGIRGDPLSSPQDGQPLVLRNYERLRKVMLENNHASGLIWITSFSWPEGMSQVNGRPLINHDEEARWLNQAYRLLRSQLYIGVAFFDQLNPTDPTDREIQTGARPGNTSGSLVFPDASLHPACSVITQLTAVNANVKTVIFEGSISKKTPMKLDMRPAAP